MVKEDNDTVSKESSPGEKCSTSEEAESMFTPRFKSVVAMAGWDEEALLIATLVVEDTPDQELTRQKKRPELQFKTPPTNSRRKRRNQRKSPSSIPMVVLNLEEDEEEIKKDDIEKNKVEQKVREKEENKAEEVIRKKKTEEELVSKNSVVSCSSPNIPCMDKLRDELSCAICLEICFEPSTTPCGHSFCKKCLRSAADKCGKKCPKCRQLVSNGRSCTVNTVLWNTIQLLFPQEIEARKTSDPSLNSSRRESQLGGFEIVTNNDSQNRSVRPASRVSSSSRDVRNRSVASQVRVSSRDGSIRVRRRTGISTQNEDAAMALRLQREEFMEAFRGSSEQTSSSARALSLARENLRAMASRAADLRLSRRHI